MDHTVQSAAQIPIDSEKRLSKLSTMRVYSAGKASIYALHWGFPYHLYHALFAVPLPPSPLPPLQTNASSPPPGDKQARVEPGLGRRLLRSLLWICIGVQPRTSLSLAYNTAPGNVTIPIYDPFTPIAYPTINSSFTATPTQVGVATDCRAWYSAAPVSPFPSPPPHFP